MNLPAPNMLADSAARPARRRPHRSAVFLRLRCRLLGNAAAAMVNHSLLRLSAILLCSLLIWGFVFLASGEGFYFLQKMRNFSLTEDIIDLAFDLLFWILNLMLVISTGLILYSSLFAAPEAGFLLGTPAGADQVFAHKYQGALGLSSWAFLLLASPVLIAYGMVAHVPWYFYALLPFFFLGFVLLPGSIGALGCLLVVNYFPRRRSHLLLVLLAGALLVLGATAWWVCRLVATARAEMWSHDLAARIEDLVAFSQWSWLPSRWMARGLREVARRDLGKAFYDLALIWSNGLFAYVLCTWVAARLYRRGYNRVATGGSLRRRYGGAWLDHTLSALVAFLNPQTRLLIVKDFRTFRRDPAQWAQVLIFLGLMSLYFANIRRVFLGDITAGYQNGISLLNLGATALLLCTYTGRFIFPMLSLEGQKFWILGLLPLRRERLLWGKFAFSAVGGLLIAEFLVMLSDFMLGLWWPVAALHALTVAVLAVGLSGLSVGLGACLPNFQESDPSRIAVGFGGTLNLVVGLLFLLLIVGLMSAPWHLFAALKEYTDQTYAGANAVIGLGVCLGLLAGAAAVIVPLRSGARALRRMEF